LRIGVRVRVRIRVRVRVGSSMKNDKNVELLG